MYSSSAASTTFDEHTTQHNLHVVDSIKDLKNLSTQLYSAAEYFEVSYTEEDQKRIVKNTLKDYVINAVVNTVSHLTSMTQSLDKFINDYISINAPAMEFRVSCAEQRLKTYQEYVDHAGLSQQSYLVRNTKYHKRYILPVGALIAQSGSKAVPRVSEFYLHDLGSEARLFQDAFRTKLKEKPQIRKVLSQSPSQSSYPLSSSSSRQSITAPSPPARQPVLPSVNGTRRSDSPIPNSNRSLLRRSGTVVDRTSGSNLNPVNNEQQVPEESQKLSSKFKLHSKSMHKSKTMKITKSKKKLTNILHAPSTSISSLPLLGSEEGSDPEVEPHRRKTKAFLKKLLSKRTGQKKKDEMMMMDVSRTSQEIEL